MRHRILFLVGLLLAMLISTTSANASETSTSRFTTKVQGAYGVVGTVGSLVELEQSIVINEYVRLSVSVGNFNNSPYVDAGFSLSYSIFTAGISGMYLGNVPSDRLTGHFQFKPRFSVAFTDRLSLVYTHISNGTALFGTNRYPNRGVDFLGIQGRW